jgi:hypothetical protein
MARSKRSCRTRRPMLRLRVCCAHYAVAAGFVQLRCRVQAWQCLSVLNSACRAAVVCSTWFEARRPRMRQAGRRRGVERCELLCILGGTAMSAQAGGVAALGRGPQARWGIVWSCARMCAHTGCATRCRDANWAALSGMY